MAESMDMVERFWAKVSRGGPEDCWLWVGYAQANNRGICYGYFRAGKMKRAHRIAWELSNGPVPVGLVIRHTCDNGLCVNPAHLKAGTQKENVADRYERGRQNHVRGSAHGIAKLTEEKVREIKALLRAGMPHRTIGRRYGVSAYPIWLIARGEGWKHVR